MASPFLIRKLGKKRASRSVLPVRNGLLLQSDSYVFDPVADTTAASSWADLSGNGRDWSAWSAGNVNVINVGSTAVGNPTVDQTIKANGHATLKFVGAGTPQLLKQAIFFGASGFTGLEVMCVFRRTADPPATSQVAGTPFQFVHPLTTFPNHVPFTDSHVYEGFARTTRPDDGNPTTDLSTAFRLYNVAAASTNDAFDIWIDTENLEHLTGSYTFSQQGEEAVNHNSLSLLYYVGMGTDYSGNVYPYAGNLACVYVWNRRLTTAERAIMKAYINRIYGTAG